jgi:hypothetical protein
VYRTEWKQIFRLRLLSEFAELPHGWSCENIYSIYRGTYFGVFGQDSEVEAAYNRCKGGGIPATGLNLCRTSWPTTEGPVVYMNQFVHSCALFETGNEAIDYVIEDAQACCSGSESSALCRFARSHSTLSDPGLNKKRCMGIYIIKGLGEYAKYMRGYFSPEVNCYGESHITEQQYAGECYSNRVYLFNALARSLPCRDDRKVVWESDTDMSRNNCNIVEPPVHASLNILKTGTCADYSVAVTTLLRKAGYSETEVYSVHQGKHVTNLVKLPGDEKYHHVDTTGNRVGIVFDGNFPLSPTGTDWTNKKRNSCVNDKGTFDCPPPSEVYETFNLFTWIGGLIGRGST